MFSSLDFSANLAALPSQPAHIVSMIIKPLRLAALCASTLALSVWARARTVSGFSLGLIHAWTAGTAPYLQGGQVSVPLSGPAMCLGWNGVTFSPTFSPELELKTARDTAVTLAMATKNKAFFMRSSRSDLP